MSEKQKLMPESLNQADNLQLKLTNFLENTIHIEEAVSGTLQTEYDKYALSTEANHKAFIEYLNHEVLTEISAIVQQKVESRIKEYIDFLKPALQHIPEKQSERVLSDYQRIIETRIYQLAEEITQKEIKNKLILLTSRVDYKTQLYNVNVFNSAIRSRIESKQKTGIAFIDLDKLGPFNEALSEDVFDHFYYQFAQYLKRITRAEDIVCRTGGDEMKVIFSGVETLEDVEAACKKISDNLKEQVFEIELTEDQALIIINAWKKNSKHFPGLVMPPVEGFSDTRSEALTVIEDNPPISTPGKVVDPIKCLRDHAIAKGVSINDIPKEEAGLIFAHNFLKSLQSHPNKRRSQKGKMIYVLKTRISASIGGSIYNPDSTPEGQPIADTISQINTIIAQAEKEAKEERGTYVVK